MRRFILKSFPRGRKSYSKGKSALFVYIPETGIVPGQENKGQDGAIDMGAQLFVQQKET